MNMKKKKKIKPHMGFYDRELNDRENIFQREIKFSLGN